MKYNELKIGDLVAKIPLVQGGMGVGISLGGLAGAVAKAGGIGLISSAQIGFREADFDTDTKAANIRAIGKELAKARSIAAAGIIGFNIMVALKYYEDYVRAAVDAGADVIVSGSGLPVDLPAYTKDSRTYIAPIVSTERSASTILKYWDRKYQRTADFIVIEGPLAGGHLGFTNEQLDLYDKTTYALEISKIIQLVGRYEKQFDCRIPVILAGGINSREQVQEAFALGASGVQIGTAFIATAECDADPAYKQALIQAKASDIAIVKSPVGMPGRAIVNSFMERVRDGQTFPPGRCRQCLKNCQPAAIPYCITERLIAAANGDVTEALLFCGAYAYKSDRITTVDAVIDELFGKIS